MSAFDWIIIVFEAALVVVGILAALKLEKLRPTETINPATDENE